MQSDLTTTKNKEAHSKTRQFINAKGKRYNDTFNTPVCSQPALYQTCNHAHISCTFVSGSSSHGRCSYSMLCGLPGLPSTVKSNTVLSTHIHTAVLWPSWILSRTTRVSRHQKRKNQEGKTNLNLLEQEIVSGSGIGRAICNSAPWPRHITMPATHHSVFTGQMPFLLHNRQHQSTEGTILLLPIFTTTVFSARLIHH